MTTAKSDANILPVATQKPLSIYEAIPKIIGEVGAIGKEKKNQQQGFMYRGVDDVMNALSPVIAKYGVFIVPEVLEETRTERSTKSGGINFVVYMKIRFTFCASDGSSVQAVTVGEAMDTADKGSNKALAVAYKYACFQVFCIATEEMKDPDAETPEPSVKQPPKNPPAKQNPPKDETKPKIEKTILCERVIDVLYPDHTDTVKGDPDAFAKGVYDAEMKAYMSLNPDLKKLSDLSINQLKDLIQKIDIPESLR